MSEATGEKKTLRKTAIVLSVSTIKTRTHALKVALNALPKAKLPPSQTGMDCFILFFLILVIPFRVLGGSHETTPRLPGA